MTSRSRPISRRGTGCWGSTAIPTPTCRPGSRSRFRIDLIYDDGQGRQATLRLYPITLGDRASISRLNLEATPIQDVRDVDVNGKPGVLLRLGAQGAETVWQEVVWEQGDLILSLSAAGLTEERADARGPVGAVSG